VAEIELVTFKTGRAHASVAGARAGADYELALRQRTDSRPTSSRVDQRFTAA
jgi:hypothetical protein